MSEQKIQTVSDNTQVAMPLRNIVSIVAGVAVATFAYSGVIERINKLETRVAIDEKTIEANTEFRIRWPRGEMGALPADNRQDMLLESTERHIRDLAQEVKDLQVWVNNFKPPREVQEAILSVRELQIRIRVLEARLEQMKSVPDL